MVGNDGHAPLNHGTEGVPEMKTRSVLIVTQAAALLSWSALATIVPATSWADDTRPGTIHTRSVEDIHADQMRDWNAKPSGKYGADIGTRSSDDMYADQMRDWNAKPSGTNGPNVQTRSPNEAYNDLVRADFPGGRPAPTNATTSEVASKK